LEFGDGGRDGVFVDLFVVEALPFSRIAFKCGGAAFVSASVEEHPGTTIPVPRHSPDQRPRAPSLNADIDRLRNITVSL
jgi:hypothetical protein